MDSKFSFCAKIGAESKICCDNRTHRLRKPLFDILFKFSSQFLSQFGYYIWIFRPKSRQDQKSDAIFEISDSRILRTLFCLVHLRILSWRYVQAPFRGRKTFLPEKKPELVPLENPFWSREDPTSRSKKVRVSTISSTWQHILAMIINPEKALQHTLAFTSRNTLVVMILSVSRRYFSTL